MYSFLNQVNKGLSLRAFFATPVLDRQGGGSLLVVKCRLLHRWDMLLAKTGGYVSLLPKIFIALLA